MNDGWILIRIPCIVRSACHDECESDPTPVNPTHILTDLFANWFSVDVAELCPGDKRGYYARRMNDVRLLDWYCEYRSRARNGIDEEDDDVRPANLFSRGGVDGGIDVAIIRHVVDVTSPSKRTEVTSPNGCPVLIAFVPLADYRCRILKTVKELHLKERYNKR